MNLTLIARANVTPTYFYVVDSDTARKKIMESTDECVYIPINDVKVVEYFVNLYAEIITTNTAPGRMRPSFRMLAVEGEWYKAEIELSENKKNYGL